MKDTNSFSDLWPQKASPSRLCPENKNRWIGSYMMQKTIYYKISGFLLQIACQFISISSLIISISHRLAFLQKTTASIFYIHGLGAQKSWNWNRERYRCLGVTIQSFSSRSRFCSTASQKSVRDTRNGCPRLRGKALLYPPACPGKGMK